MPTITDATVVAQAYDTSGNGGRKLVKLDSGALVAVAKDATSQFVWKTTDNWNTKTVIASGTTYTSSQDVALCTDGKNIFRLFGYNNSTIVFNSWTESGVRLTSLNLDTSQTALGNVSLAINEAKTELHATWASKNSTYPNSFNVRYAKGTINADGTVTWGAVEQVTNANNSGYNMQNPCIYLDRESFVHIAISYSSSNPNYILDLSKRYTTQSVSISNTGWGNTTIFSGVTYIQSSPSAIYVPQSINGLANGRIWVAWHGTDATDTTATNIRVSYSDDGGVTWSAMQKLTSGNAYTQTNATITANNNNGIFILWNGFSVSNPSSYNIRKIKNANDVWGSIVEYTASGKTNLNPSSLFDTSFSLSFSDPLFIYSANTDAKVGFYGTWTVTTISVTPGDIGQKTDKNNILSYSITTDGEMSTITEKINGTVVNTRTATSGQAVQLGLTQAQWDAIRFGKYADATGGKNTLTVEMGGEKWTYTFDKRLATDADIVSASKAVKDSNEVYLPAQINRLVDVAKEKGAVIPSNPKFDDVIDGIKNSPNGRKARGTGIGANIPNLTISGLSFKPSLVEVRVRQKNGGIWRSRVTLDDALDMYSGNKCFFLSYNTTTSESPGIFYYVGSYCTSDGFFINNNTSTSYNYLFNNNYEYEWVAYENER